MSDTPIERAALIRGRHRLLLSRRWDVAAEAATVTWIMLNPSRADDRQDDPTIRRCIAFSRAWGFGGLRVVNLFTRITPSPRDLFAHRRLNHPDADAALDEAFAGAAVILGAWGAHAREARAARRVRFVHELAARHGRSLQCLGVTKGGHPRHPLYLGGDVRLCDLPSGPGDLPC